MKYHCNTDNYALAWVMAPVNSFGSAIMDMATCIAETTLLGSTLKHFSDVIIFSIGYFVISRKKKT